MDRVGSTGAAVADEASRVVVPLGEQKIDRVLERARDSMVILGRDENEAIKRTDLSGPRFGVRLTVLPHYWWHWLVQKRQGEILDVDELAIGGASLFCGFVNTLTQSPALL